MQWREADVTNPDDGVVERMFVMVPLAQYRRHAGRQYQADAEYTLAPVEQRSKAQHNRYFAALKEAYDSMPEKVSARWESVNHFRYWALIEVGAFTEKEFTFEGRDSEIQARRLGTFAQTEDEHARIWITCVQEADTNMAGMIDAAERAYNRSEDTLPFRERLTAGLRGAWRYLNRGSQHAIWKVIIRKAKSQDHASMKKGEFKETSDKVLDLAAALIGTRRSDINRAAGRSA